MDNPLGDNDLLGSASPTGAPPSQPQAAASEPGGAGGAAAGGTSEPAEGEAKTKEQDTKKSTEYLNLKVKAQDGNEVYFKVKRTTQFKKLMEAYCSRVGASPANVRFLFDGSRIRPDQTPADLEMEDEDEIDAMVQQQGGL